ncbi:hypothetical protein, partial [Endozoicomonas sp. ALC013]|uniref:hypothetical protein n=1 Tax=Endozoicomonas sp. ALC013 TaxID=3403076 RepID=UPI003BB4971D
RQFEQVAGFHGLKALLMQWLRWEFIRWLWENQAVPKRYKKTAPFSRITFTTNCSKGTVWYRF